MLKNYSAPRLLEESIETFLRNILNSKEGLISVPIPIEYIITEYFGYRLITQDLSYLGEGVKGVTFIEQKEVLVDPSCGRQRRNFVLSHELSHILIHECLSNSPRPELHEIQRFIKELLPDKSSNILTNVERLANRLAAMLLMPLSEVIFRIEHLDSIGPEEVKAHHVDFQVSVSVLALRLLKLEQEYCLFRKSKSGNPILIPLQSNALRECISELKKKSRKRVHHRRSFSLRLLPLRTSKFPQVSYVESEKQLEEKIHALGDARQIGVIYGGISYMTAESLQMMSLIKAQKRKLVVVCENQKQLQFLSEFKHIDFIFVVNYPWPITPSIELLPYLWANTAPDTWLARSLAHESLVHIHEKKPLFRTQIENTQLALWGKKTIFSYRTERDAAKFARKVQVEGQKVILSTGGYDLLHIGHVSFLQKAKKKNEVLIVGIEPDLNIFAYKGRLINPLHVRYAMLEALECVDFVFVMSKLNKWPSADYWTYLCNYIHPDIRVTTANDPFRKEKRKQIESAGGNLRLIDSYTHGYSTTTEYARLIQLEKVGDWQNDLKVWQIARPVVSYTLVSQAIKSDQIAVSTPVHYHQLDLFTNVQDPNEEVPSDSSRLEQKEFAYEYG